jgi:hypothetical protein
MNYCYSAEILFAGFNINAWLKLIDRTEMLFSFNLCEVFHFCGLFLLQYDISCGEFSA